MLAAIRIKEKQYLKLRNLIINEKLDFSLVGSRCLDKSEINWQGGGDNLEVTINIYSGNPGDLFTLGQKFKAIPDPIIM